MECREMSPFIFIFSELLMIDKVVHNDMRTVSAKLCANPKNWSQPPFHRSRAEWNWKISSFSEWIIFVDFLLDVGDSLDLCFLHWRLSRLKSLLALTDLLHLHFLPAAALGAAGALQVLAPSPLLLLTLPTDLWASRVLRLNSLSLRNMQTKGMESAKKNEKSEELQKLTIYLHLGR